MRNCCAPTARCSDLLLSLCPGVAKQPLGCCGLCPFRVTRGMHKLLHTNGQVLWSAAESLALGV